MFCTVCFKNSRIVCRMCLRMVKKEMDNKNIQNRNLIWDRIVGILMGLFLEEKEKVWNRENMGD